MGIKHGKLAEAIESTERMARRFSDPSWQLQWVYPIEGKREKKCFIWPRERHTYV